MSKRFLIIIYQYYPLITPRAIRWHAISKEIVKRGFEVDVVCCAYHNLPGFEIVDGINIHRIKPWFFKSIYRKNIVSITDNESSKNNKTISDHTINNQADFRNYDKKKNSGLFEQFVSVIISIFSNLYRIFWWPDFGMFWIPPALKKSQELINKKKYLKVFSVSWPVSAHKIGFMLNKRLIVEGIPLVIDVGDPFSLNEFTSSNNKTLYKKINQSFEKSLFKRASGIAVTNQAIKHLYVKKFSINEEKIKVIPPLSSFLKPEEDLNPLKNRNKLNIKFIYSGSFRRGNRPPKLLFNLFSDLFIQYNRNNIELHIFGDISEFEKEIKAFQKKFNDNIFIYGLVPQRTVNAAIVHGDVLINIGNMSAYQIPSKLADYIFTGKPIVNIQMIEKDSSYDFLKNYPLLTNLDFYNQVYDINLRKINTLINQLPEKISPSTLDNITKKYSVSNITDDYLFDWWK